MKHTTNGEYISRKTQDQTKALIDVQETYIVHWRKLQDHRRVKDDKLISKAGNYLTLFFPLQNKT